MLFLLELILSGLIFACLLTLLTVGNWLAASNYYAAGYNN